MAGLRVDKTTKDKQLCAISILVGLLTFGFLWEAVTTCTAKERHTIHLAVSTHFGLVLLLVLVPQKGFDRNLILYYFDWKLQSIYLSTKVSQGEGTSFGELTRCYQFVKIVGQSKKEKTCSVL